MAKYIQEFHKFQKQTNQKKDPYGAVGRVMVPGDEVNSVGRVIEPYTKSVTNRIII
jgi:hypothetical protein